MGNFVPKNPDMDGYECNGFLQHCAIARDLATLHKNFEKWNFPFSDVKDGCDFNGGGLAILRLHF